MSDLDWGDHLRAFRRRRCLTQTALAKMMGVEQATVSRWETGWLRPGPDARRRLREVVLAFECRADRAIMNSVRCAEYPVTLVDLDADRFVAASAGFCQLNAVHPGAVAHLSLKASVSSEARDAIGNRSLVAALLNQEIAGVRIYGHAPRLGGGLPHRVRATVTPLWLSDGRCLLRVEDVMVPDRLPFAKGVEPIPLH